MSDLTENRSIPKSVTRLSLENNGFHGIASIGALPKLIFLGLSRNKIERIPANIFSGLTNLERLSFNDNSISRIENGAFSGLNNLDCLYLRRNKLSALNKNTFKGFHNLIYLTLEGNRISIINSQTFSGLVNLMQINLSKQDGPVDVDLNAFSQFISLKRKTMVYTAVRNEPDNFEKEDREKFNIIL